MFKGHKTWFVPFPPPSPDFVKIGEGKSKYPGISKDIPEYPYDILESLMSPFFLPHVVTD